MSLFNPKAPLGWWFHSCFTVNLTTWERLKHCPSLPQIATELKLKAKSLEFLGSQSLQACLDVLNHLHFLRQSAFNFFVSYKKNCCICETFIFNKLMFKYKNISIESDHSTITVERVVPPHPLWSMVREIEYYLLVCWFMLATACITH